MLFRVLSVLATASFWVGAGRLAAEQPSPHVESDAEPIPAFENGLRPFLAKYCFDCHGVESPEGNLSLEKFQTDKDLRGDWSVWAKALARLQRREMPPPDATQPSADERQRATQWILTALQAVDCNANKDPGRVTIRRLNRAEYQNTIRDLLGVAFNPSDEFPVDDSGYGFDNIGDVLTMSPLLMEKYMNAARVISAQAILTPESLDRPLAVYGPKKLHGGNLSGGVRALYTSDKIGARHRFQSDGRYVIRARVYAQQAGPELARVGFLVDGRAVCQSDVVADEDEAETLTAVVHVDAGQRPVEIAFLNDYYEPKAADPDDRDRNLYVEELGVVGPVDHEFENAPAAQLQIIGAAPKTDDWIPAARQSAIAFAFRAYRRPATDKEVDRLARLAGQVRADGGSFERAIQTVVQAVLVSPHFLYRGELDPDPNNATAIRPLNQWELASRLSYFLWSSMPDADLFDRATDGTLRENLSNEVERMMADDKAAALSENFAGQWLETRRIEESQPDPERFQGVDASLRGAMRSETQLFFASLIHENRGLQTLIDADYTFLNEPLAKHYGIEGVHGNNFRRVKLNPKDHRSGILTHASILTITSNPTRTSPVKRGKWILEQLLNDPPPPPPPGAGQLPTAGKADASLSLREQMEIHRRDPTCYSCHNKMDPLGFALENYDAVGRWRDQEAGKPVDASGVLPDGRRFSGADGLQKILLDQPRRLRRAVTEKMLIYALGRGLEYYDRCAVEKITKRLEENDDRFSVLIQAIVESYPFQYRRGDGGQP